MVTALLQFAAAALVIVLAGAFLARFADIIAERTGLGRLLVGSILLAGATSLPELAVDVNAIRQGLPDIAVGDLMGSSLFNLLILAVLDLSHRSGGRMFSRASVAHGLSGTASIAMAGLAAMSLLVTRQWPDATLAGVGPGPLALLVAYALVARLIYFDQRISAASAGVSPPAASHVTAWWTLPRAAAGFGGCAIIILVAGPFLASAAGRIAELSGAGETFVGSTLVAFSTSLPELVTTGAAVRMGSFDLAIGNIYGSNAFNMALLAPLDLVHPGSILADTSPIHAVTCLASVLATAAAVLGQLYQVEKRKRLVEPDAFLVILLVLGALALLYFLR